jgi:hypothetical protein
MKNIFVFDLDDVVVKPIFTSDTRERIYQELDQYIGVEFRKKMSVDIMGYTHMIYPGFFTLFQWIHNRGDVFYFFSTGVKERNEKITKIIIKKTFNELAPKIIKQTKIFSREDCLDTTLLEDGRSSKYQPVSFYGNKKKKLKGVVVSKEQLPNTLLIDDDPSYILKGEEKNFIKVPLTTFYFQPNYEKTFYSFHTAFYICGLLAKIISISKKKNIPLRESSWSLIDDDLKPENHTAKELKNNQYRHLHNTKDLSFYKSGLKILQEINPELDFLLDPKEFIKNN